MADHVVITADNACDLGTDLMQKYQIHCTPFYIVLGEKEYVSDVDITPDEIFRKFREKGEMPKTAAIGVEEYVQFFKTFLDQGKEVIHISIGAGLSSAFQNCLAASEQCGGKVHVIDSQNLSTGIGLLVIEAAVMAQRGESVEHICTVIQESVAKSHASFILDRLQFMKAGGRCSSVMALGANLLSIKPSIAMEHGAMGVKKKYRGTLTKVADQYVQDTLTEFDDIKRDRVFITHSGVPQEVLDVVFRKVKSSRKFDEILVTTAGSTVSSHCGPDVIGVLFLTN